MPITLRHNEVLELNLVEYQGAVTWDELKQLASFGARNPDHLRRDTLSWVLPGAHFREIDFARLDALYDHYRKLFAPMDFQIFRRSAWLCESADAMEHVRYWLTGRDAREALSSTVRDFTNLSDAGEWLLLNQGEIARVERRDGFEGLVSFDLPKKRTLAL